MGKTICIVCGHECRDLVKPFGILTEAVPAHHYHDDKSIRDAWIDIQDQTFRPTVDRVTSR